MWSLYLQFVRYCNFRLLFVSVDDNYLTIISGNSSIIFKNIDPGLKGVSYIRNAGDKSYISFSVIVTNRIPGSTSLPGDNYNFFIPGEVSNFSAAIKRLTVVYIVDLNFTI